MSVRLSWAQHIVLQAASQVDQLPFRAWFQINLPYGVWRSLICRGFLRGVPEGWEITPEGRTVLLQQKFKVIPWKPKDKQTMEGKQKQFRYTVSRVTNGWAIIDRDISKIRMHNDVVEVVSSRDVARRKAAHMNRELHRAQEEIERQAAQSQ